MYTHSVQLQAIKYRWNKHLVDSSLPSQLITKFMVIEKLYDDVVFLLDYYIIDNENSINQNNENIFSKIGMCFIK